MEGGKVKKVGVKEIQREGFEYELTVNFNLDRDSHTAIASKDNTQLFEGKDPFVITENTGKLLKKWVSAGAVDKEAKLRVKIKTQVEEWGKSIVALERKYGPIEEMALDTLKRLSGQIAKKLKKPIKKADPVSEALKKSVKKHQ